MKIANIGNINYKGIKVFNTNLQKQQDPRQVSYDTVSYEIDKLVKEAESINEDFFQEKVRRVEEKYNAQLKNRFAQIDSEAENSFTTRILKSYLKDIAADEINKKRQEEVANILKHSNIDEIKNELIKEAENKLEDTKEKMLIYELATFYKYRKSLQSASAAKAAIKDKKSRGDFSAIAGYDKEKEVLDNVFVHEVYKEKNGQEANVVGSVLFFGPWNNGKTHISKSVAKEADCRFVEYKSMNNKTFVHDLYDLGYEAEEHFKKTGQRTIIFIDELDRYVSNNSSQSIRQDFAAFTGVCSWGLHTTVFAATNNPERLGIGVGGQQAFPIVMSIDIPDDKNLKAMLQFYFEDVAKSDVDYDEMVKEIRKVEENFERKYSNGQIVDLFSQMVKKYNKSFLSQKEIISFIQSAQIKPELDEQDILMFQNQYKMLMGG